MILLPGRTSDTRSRSSSSDVASTDEMVRWPLTGPTRPDVFGRFEACKAIERVRAVSEPLQSSILSRQARPRAVLCCSAASPCPVKCASVPAYVGEVDARGDLGRQNEVSDAFGGGCPENPGQTASVSPRPWPSEIPERQARGRPRRVLGRRGCRTRNDVTPKLTKL